MRISKVKIVLPVSLISLLLSGCGMFDSSSVVETTTTSLTTRKFVEATKTASQQLNPDADDDDIDGYTTTQSESVASLENTVSMDEGYDPNILATYTTVTTLYTLPKGATSKTETKKTKKTTKVTTKKTTTATTKFTADKLYTPTEDDKFKKKKKYKVTSDTTYLNLRFGPSRDYNVQLKIPDDEIVYGTAQTTNANESSEKWVYVSYKGTGGWVMLNLLTKEQ